jgi:hypothetical protein
LATGRRRLESWWKICTQRPQLTFWEEIHPFVKDTTMPSAPLPPEKAAEVQALAEAIRQAVNAEVEELASTLAHTDDQHLFGQNEFKLRDLAHKIAAKALEQRLAQKKRLPRGQRDLPALWRRRRIPFPSPAHPHQPGRPHPLHAGLLPVPLLWQRIIPLRPTGRAHAPESYSRAGARRHFGRNGG